MWVAVGSYTEEILHKFTEQNCNYEGVVSCQRNNMTLIVNRALTNFQEYVFRGCVEMAVSRDN